MKRTKQHANLGERVSNSSENKDYIFWHMKRYSWVDRFQLWEGNEAYILRVVVVRLEVASSFEVLVNLYKSALRHILEAYVVTVFSYFLCFSSRFCI
jgi:hypothetical protein